MCIRYLFDLLFICKNNNNVLYVKEIVKER